MLIGSRPFFEDLYPGARPYYDELYPGTAGAKAQVRSL